MPEQTKCCGTCKHYGPARNEKTGRVTPSKAGECDYPVKWPELPASYYANRMWSIFPRPNPVWPGSHHDCKMYEPKSKPPKASLVAQQVELIRENENNP